MSIPATHQALCEDLAEYLRRSGYKTAVEIRKVGVQTYGDAGRIDVLAVAPWTGITKFEVIAFEVKRTRSDFLSDVNSGKWQRYYTEYGVPRIAFAALEGVAGVADVPIDAGLFVRSESGWKRHKAGRPVHRDASKLDPLLLLSMISGQDRMFRRYEPPKARDHGSFRMVMEAVANAVGGLSNADVQEYAERVGARKLGYEIARRAHSGKEVAGLNAYAEHILELCADLAGGDRGEFRKSIISASDRTYGDQFQYEKVASLLREALFIRRNMNKAKLLLEGAQSIIGGSNNEYDQSRRERAEDTLAKLAAEEDAERDVYNDLLKKRRKKRGAA